MSRYGNEKEIRKAMKSPRKFIFTLEEIIDMLAKLDDDGHGDKMVQVEGPDGQLHSISAINIEEDKVD
jgi:hypothetical protein